MNLHSQVMPIVFSASAYGAVAAKEDASGSLISNGYARLVGIFRSDAAVALGAGSGLYVEQSSNWGGNWDITSASCQITACAASTFDLEVLGNAVRVRLINGDTATSRIRCNFMLRPI